MEYDEYLQSPRWREVRKVMLGLQRCCQKCRFKYELNVHHRTYERLGCERIPGDLIVLCRSCHSRHHFVEDMKANKIVEKLAGVSADVAEQRIERQAKEVKKKITDEEDAAMKARRDRN